MFQDRMGAIHAVRVRPYEATRSFGAIVKYSDDISNLFFKLLFYLYLRYAILKQVSVKLTNPI